MIVEHINGVCIAKSGCGYGKIDVDIHVYTALTSTKNIINVLICRMDAPVEE